MGSADRASCLRLRVLLRRSGWTSRKLSCAVIAHCTHLHHLPVHGSGTRSTTRHPLRLRTRPSDDTINLTLHPINHHDRAVGDSLDGRRGRSLWQTTTLVCLPC